MTEILFDKDEDWEKRVLCSDESCIGTVGPDGKCRECGKPYEGVLPQGHGIETYRPVVEEESKPVVPETAAAGDDDEWEKRVLCSDESCIGTVGPDGKCRECGKPINS